MPRRPGALEPDPTGYNMPGGKNMVIFGWHCGLSQYTGSSFGHLPNGVDGSVLALYAFGSETCQFLGPNDPHLHQDTNNLVIVYL